MTDWARRVMDEVDGALPPVTEGIRALRRAADRYDAMTPDEIAALPPLLDVTPIGGDIYPDGTVVRRYALSRHDDARTGFATENVVPVTTAEQDATRKWIESLFWGTGEDVR